MSEPLSEALLLDRTTQNSFHVLQGLTRIKTAMRCLPKEVKFNVRVADEGKRVLRLTKPLLKPYSEGLLASPDGSVELIRFFVN